MKQASEPRRVELPISVGAASEIGLREQNQDCMTGFSSPFGAAYVVADGMGGHQGGADASRMTADGFTRHLLAAPPTSPLRDAITLAVRMANLEVIEKARSGEPGFAGMGSTIVVAVVRSSGGGLELTTANVGDSRVYLQRGNELTLLTRDHTRAQWLVDNGVIDAEAARTHPEASVLTRAIGHVTNLEVDISNPIPLVAGDGILLCSDGLSGFASDADILRTIQLSADPADCVHRLVQLALTANSNDNITVQFLRIGGSASADDGKVRKSLGTGGAEVPARTRRGWVWTAILLLIFAICAAGGYALWELRYSMTGAPATDRVAALSAQIGRDQSFGHQLASEAMRDSQAEAEMLEQLNERSEPQQALIDQVQADRNTCDDVIIRVHSVIADLGNVGAQLSAAPTGKTLAAMMDKEKKDAASLTLEQNVLKKLEDKQPALRRAVEAGETQPSQPAQPPAATPSAAKAPAQGPSGGAAPGGKSAAPADAPGGGAQPAPGSGQPAPAKPPTSGPPQKPANGSQPQAQPGSPNSLPADADAGHQPTNISDRPAERNFHEDMPESQLPD